MKQMFFGTILIALGTVWTLTLTVLSIIHPWEYNGMDGLLGFLMGSNTVIIFIFAVMATLAGLCICLYESHLKK